MTNFKLLDGTIAKSGQATTFLYICSYGDLRVRFTIKSDSYDAQCVAHADVWSAAELKWNRVAYIPNGDIETDSGLCYRPNWKDERHYSADYDRLQALVKLVLA